MSNFRAGDYVIVRGESGEANVGRLGIVRSQGSPLVRVEFKEGDTAEIEESALQKLNLMVYVPGDFVTLVDTDVYDEGRLIATSGDPAIVLEHDPKAKRVKLGVMRSPDDRPYHFMIDDRKVRYRESWDSDGA
jgi:hypothetical protein